MSHAQHRLMQELHKYEEARFQLEQDEVPLEWLQDTLEGCHDIDAACLALAAERMEALNWIDVLKGREAEIAQRKAALQARADKYKAAIEHGMQHAGFDKIPGPFYTLSLRKGQQHTVITDEDQIPERFWRPQPAKLDRTALKDALKAGEAVGGATLSNGAPSLSIRKA